MDHITQENDYIEKNRMNNKKQICFTLLGNRDIVYQERTTVETVQHNINDQITNYQSTMYDLSDYITNIRLWFRSLTWKQIFTFIFESILFLIKLIFL